MNFENIIGHANIKNYLINSLAQQNISHSYLFLGTEGIGKLLMAKEFAKKILCLENKENTCQCKSCVCFDGQNHSDFMLVNEEGETIKVEQIRAITEKIIEKPILSSKKVYILNDCEKMTKEAQNCLLKTLEEPPDFAVLLLISSNPNRILPTIQSRCIPIRFSPISDSDLKQYALNVIGYTKITENLLKSFHGSIAKAIHRKENIALYLKIEQFIRELPENDLIDIMLKGKILYDKENIYDILEYMTICFYTNAKKDKRMIHAIEEVNQCIKRLTSNCNFDMSMDTMLFNIGEEFHENSYRC